MFEEGNIIYFDPFYFKNGNPAKPKYFVVLKNDGYQNIVASLPTRTDSIPQKDTIESGCVEIPSINLNCFVFAPSQIITNCNKFFDFPTHLYGHQIDDYTIESLQELYPNEGTDYSLWGKMKSNLFEELINCFKNSKSVKRKYKKLL
ncbi:hypothetical protein [Epilithonimonas xixisoli]|uniref:PemK-like, MazF-like toxin of type II toxin-antitoxin system n=1 Tax=Epilithonimonas xixisoli TaxID=1476462 RepID=A0A4R8IFP0_9FLAO|nr:hypothetical protein [Epilithonimonas xixisoli]TDX84540.1 hypothetical protein B0I22_2163 [Epilithonimonas xixisoli]